MPHVAACVATIDPATLLMTGTYRFQGDLQGQDDHDHEFGLIEYGTVERTSFIELVEEEIRPPVWISSPTATPRGPDRLCALMEPSFGFRDEVRLPCRARIAAVGWWRCSGARTTRPFTGRVDFLGSLSAAFATGCDPVCSPACGRTPGRQVFRPAVVIVGADDQTGQLSLGAEEVLRREPHYRRAIPPHHPRRSRGWRAATRAARRRPCPCRVRIVPAPGCCCTPGRCRRGARAAISSSPIEAARPPEIVALVVAAFG